jgi:septum site-determining protein MinC
MDIIPMGENITKTQAFKLKGRLYTFTVLHVLTVDQEQFKQQCAETVIKAPKLFEKTPIVFDLSSVNHLEFDWQALCQITRDHGMIPVAIQGANPLQETLAQCQGLAVLHASTSQDKPIEHAVEKTAEITKSKLITNPVRSGQQIVAKGSDLIVTSSVSHGAELLSDGSIHVYGALRGRALAGISGDLEARIYCQLLEAELVSIAGFYRLSDAIEPISGPCQIYLDNEHIVIEPL